MSSSYGFQDCHYAVPQGLYIPTMCGLFQMLPECEKRGFDAMYMDEFAACSWDMMEGYVNMTENEFYGFLKESDAYFNEQCSSLYSNYDNNRLDHFAVCLEHMYGYGYHEANVAFLGLDMHGGIFYPSWDTSSWKNSQWSSWYSSPDYSWSSSSWWMNSHWWSSSAPYNRWNDLPKEPLQRLNVLMHAMAKQVLPGYNRCEPHEYMCMDQSCIPDYWECDQIVDCWEHEDEMFCGRKQHQTGYGAFKRRR